MADAGEHDEATSAADPADIPALLVVLLTMVHAALTSQDAPTHWLPHERLMLRQALPVLLFLLAADGWPQPPLDALPAAKQTVRNALQALAAAPVLPGVGDVVLTAAAPLWRCPALLPLVQDSADQLQGWQLQGSALQHNLPTVAATARTQHAAAVDALHAAAQGVPTTHATLTVLTNALQLLSTWTTALLEFHACVVFDAQATALRTWPGVTTFDAVPVPWNPTSLQHTLDLYACTRSLLSAVQRHWPALATHARHEAYSQIQRAVHSTMPHMIKAGSRSRSHAMLLGLRALLVHWPAASAAQRDGAGHGRARRSKAPPSPRPPPSPGAANQVAATPHPAQLRAALLLVVQLLDEAQRLGPRTAINKDADLSTTSCQQLQQLMTTLTALQLFTRAPYMFAHVAAAPGALVQGKAVWELLNDPTAASSRSEALPLLLLRVALEGGPKGLGAAAALLPAQLFNDAAVWCGQGDVPGELGQQAEAFCEAMLDHIADRMLADALTNPTTLHTWAPLLSQSGVLILQRYVELETALSVKLNARLEEALTEAASAMAGALTELTVVGGHVGELQAAHAALSQRVGVDSWHALVHAAGLQRRLVAWVVDQVNDQLLPRSSYCHTRCAYGSQQPYQSATSTVTLDSERGTQASPRLGVGWTTASAVDRLAAKFKRSLTRKPSSPHPQPPSPVQQPSPTPTPTAAPSVAVDHAALQAAMRIAGPSLLPPLLQMLYSTATNLLLNALPAALPYLYTSAASAVRATAPPAVRAPNAAARVSWHCARWAPALSSDAAIADAWGALRTLGNALALVMLLDREQGCGAMAAAGHGAALLGLQALPNGSVATAAYTPPPTHSPAHHASSSKTSTAPATTTTPLASLVLRDASPKIGAVAQLADIARQAEGAVLHALQPTSLTAAFVLHCLKTVQAAPQRDMLSGMGGVAWFQLWQGMLLCLCSDEPAMEFGRASMRKAWGDGLLLGGTLLTHVLGQDVDFWLTNPLSHVADAVQLHPPDGSEANALQLHMFLEHAAHCDAVMLETSQTLAVAGRWAWGRPVELPPCRVEGGGVPRVYAADLPQHRPPPLYEGPFLQAGGQPFD